MLLFALFGLIYGFVLQRSGFCFARAAYEILLLRTRDAVSGVMAGLLVATVGFGAVTLLGMHAGLLKDSQLLVLPLGAGTVLGAALFGAGMALAGMCAAGTLVRIGEGYVVAWATLAGIVGGAALDPFRLLPPRLLNSWRPGPSLDQWMNPAAGFLLTAVTIALLWKALARGQAGSPDAATPASWRSRARALLVPTVLGGILLGLLNTAQMAVAMPWTVGYPLTLVPSMVAAAPPQGGLPAALPLLVLDGCMVVGALIAGAGSLRLRWPRRSREVICGLLGGLLMGWGTQTAHGCNIGGVFSAIPSLSVSGWVYAPALLLGAWAGAKLLSRIG
jgi:uncharacterized membrane protein YedE/YeeE